jgi:hypothetical protein
MKCSCSERSCHNGVFYFVAASFVIGPLLGGYGGDILFVHGCDPDKLGLCASGFTPVNVTVLGHTNATRWASDGKAHTGVNWGYPDDPPNTFLCKNRDVRTDSVAASSACARHLYPVGTQAWLVLPSCDSLERLAAVARLGFVVFMFGVVDLSLAFLVLIAVFFVAWLKSKYKFQWCCVRYNHQTL